MDDTYRSARRRVRDDFERLAQFGTWEFFVGTGEVAWSRGTYRVLGVPRTEPAALETFVSMIHPDDLDRYGAVMRRLEEHGEAFHTDLRIIRRDGETRHLQTLGHRADDPETGRHRLVGAIQDITDLRRLQSDRVDLLARLLATGEEERRRLAGRVHDDVVQELAVARYRIEAAADELGRDVAERFQEPIVAATDALRAILIDLVPPVGDPAQFRGLLASYVEHVVGPTTDVHLDVADVSDAADLTLVTALGIAREALSNASRHAQATVITVRIEATDTHLDLRIEDDGIGFDAAEAAPVPGHMGLQLMHDRAEDLRGEFRLDSRPGAGTTVSPVLPLDPATVT